MLIIGCDFHTRYQQIAMLDTLTGELTERRLDHESGEAHAFYRGLQGPVRVGIEATGPIHWFERLLAELGHELWIGDAAKIRAREVRKQKTDERDAALILELLLSNRFPRIWVPTSYGTPRIAPVGMSGRGGFTRARWMRTTCGSRCAMQNAIRCGFRDGHVGQALVGCQLAGISGMRGSGSGTRRDPQVHAHGSSAGDSGVPP